jgi:hypothetical protein
MVPQRRLKIKVGKIQASAGSGAMDSSAGTIALSPTDPASKATLVTMEIQSQEWLFTSSVFSWSWLEVFMASMDKN